MQVRTGCALCGRGTMHRYFRSISAPRVVFTQDSYHTMYHGVSEHLGSLGHLDSGLLHVGASWLLGA